MFMDPVQKTQRSPSPEKHSKNEAFLEKQDFVMLFSDLVLLSALVIMTPTKFNQLNLNLLRFSLSLHVFQQNASLVSSRFKPLALRWLGVGSEGRAVY